MRGADQLVAALHSAGVKTIFSLSGNQIMPVYDAVIDNDINIIHTRHEAGAVYMADGFARASGGIGVALVTAGPGLTNALGPLFAIGKTETPLLLLSGDSPMAQDQMMPFQRMMQNEIAAPLVKESWRAMNANRLSGDIAGAVRLARSGRPAPIHIALPQDVLSGEATEVHLHADQFKPEPMELANADLPSILNMLEGAEKPIIITGPSLHELRAPGVAAALSEKLNVPVICMQSPRGLNDPSAGKIKKVLAEADTILLIDKDVDFTLASGNPELISAERFALIASQAESIAHASTILAGRLHWGCIGDPMTAVDALMEIETYKGPAKWKQAVMKALAERPTPPTYGDVLNAHQISSVIHDIMADHDPLYVIDGGETGQWAQSVLPSDHALTNGLSGAIGGGIPQAIGAAMARPEKHVVAIMGDGSSGFLIGEIETARRLGLKITVVICNDLRWGAEVEIQKRVYGEDRVHSCNLDDKTRYDKVAQAFGANGVMVETEDALRAALEKSLKSRKPTVINAMMEGLPAPSF